MSPEVKKYLEDIRAAALREARRRRALPMQGTLSIKEADRLRRHLAGLRKHWR
jgi:hypothetical protein